MVTHWIKTNTTSHEIIIKVKLRHLEECQVYIKLSIIAIIKDASDFFVSIIKYM